MTFADLGLSDELLRAVADSGYDEPTPIQRAAIPSVLMGKDLIGIAQTGTGKTAGFVLPMIDILHHGRSRARMPRSLILEPTRELAMQVAENFEKYGKYHPLSMALLIGGVQMGDQVKALEKGVDVLIATPGRLMDLFGRGKIMLNDCNLLVIDEADRMLDMGFIPDIEEICSKLPKSRQTLLFSATMPPPIQKLAAKFLNDPKRVEVARPATANVNIEQRLVEVRADKKKDALRDILRARGIQERDRLLPTARRRCASSPRSLKRSGFAVGQIQGDMDQSDRIAEFDRFKNGRDQHPRRVRRRRPRARRQRRQPRHQLRRAVAARRLHPPHRPHRPRRHEGHRHHARHARGRRGVGRDREADRPQDPARRAPSEAPVEAEPREPRAEAPKPSRSASAASRAKAERPAKPSAKPSADAGRSRRPSASRAQAATEARALDRWSRTSSRLERPAAGSCRVERRLGHIADTGKRRDARS